MIRPPPTPTLFPYTTLFRSHGAARPIHVRAELTCEKPSAAQRVGDVWRRSRIALVIPLVVACDGAPHVVVEIVGPYGVESMAAAFGFGDQRRIVALVFGDEQHVPIRDRRVNPFAQFSEEVARAVVVQRMRRVETQAIDV